MKKSWFTLTHEDTQHVIAGLVRDKQLELALEHFRSMQNEQQPPSMWLIHLLIHASLSINAWPEVEELLDCRLSFFTATNPVPSALWSAILTTAARARYHPLVSLVWNHSVATSYLNPATGTCSLVLESCALAGDHALASDVFRALGERSASISPWHYESLLEAYLSADDVVSALTVLSIMQKSSRPPADSTARPLYLHLRNNTTSVFRAHDFLKEKADSGAPLPLCAANALLEAHADAADVSAALELYKTLPSLAAGRPTTHTFNALLRACAPHGRKDAAMFLAAEMQALDVAPDAATFDSLVLTCINGQSNSHSDDVDADWEDAWRYFEEMRAAGWWPRKATVAALARGCVNRGDSRIWLFLDLCEESGALDVLGLRRVVERRWKEKWSEDNISRKSVAQEPMDGKITPRFANSETDAAASARNSAQQAATTDQDNGSKEQSTPPLMPWQDANEDSADEAKSEAADSAEAGRDRVRVWIADGALG